MNVNTYEATPVLDEIIEVSRKPRMFNDGSDWHPLWFELQPGRFWCGDTVEDAQETQRRSPRCGVVVSALTSYYPQGILSDL